MKRWICAVMAIVMMLSLFACASRNAESTAGDTTPQPTPEVTTPEATTTVPNTSATPDMVSITFYREGQGTTLSVPMVTGSAGNFRIATNPELFRQESSNGSDVFWYTLWEGQPNIYYSVSYNPDMTAEYMEGGLLHQNDGATSKKVKIGQYNAIAVYASKDDQFMTQQHFYLIPHGTGCFMIETQFVMEMYEGLFPQMRALFDTFVILE